MFANNRNRYFYTRLKIRSGIENLCFVELWPTISIQKVRREFDAGRVNLDPPMTCADWPEQITWPYFKLKPSVNSNSDTGVTVCPCMRFACVIRSGYLVLANQHTSSEGQGSRELRQTRVEPYWIEIVGHSSTKHQFSLPLRIFNRL